MPAASLTVSAVYHEVGDFVGVETALLDSSDEALDPAEVKSMSVALKRGETTLAQVTGLNKFYADEHLYYNVRFNKPAATRGLTVEVTVVERSTDETWRKLVNVSIGVYSNAEDNFGDNRPTTRE